ncbi:hypothetical protein JCM15124A_17500 [Prevotella falsenii]
MYAGQLVGQSKKRGWIRFLTSKASEFETIKNFTPENDQFQAHGPLCSAYDGKDCYVIFGHSYTYGVQPLYFAKMDVATGDTTTIYTFNEDEKDKWYNGYDIYALSYDPVSKQIYGLGKDYETKNIDGEDKIVKAFSTIYTLNKETGEFSKVKSLEQVYYNFCFDYDGNCYMIRPKAKSAEDVTIVGTEIVKFDTNLNEVAAAECKSEWGEVYIQRYFGTMSFDYTTGNLWWIPVGEHGATTIYTLNTETGVYKSTSWFNVGNSFVGLTIPYMTADSRVAPAQVSNIDAQADINGAMVDTIKWVNPTKAWNKSDLKDLKEVLVYRKKQNVATTELTPTATLLSATNADLIATVDATNMMGKPMKYVDEHPYSGINTYYVVASLANGEKGVPDSVRCFMGIDVPGIVQDIQIKRKGTGIELSWKAPTKGINNGYIKESELTYTLTRMPDKVVVAKDLSGTTYEDNTLGEQQKYSYKIQAKSNAGEGGIVESEGIMAGSALVTPIDLKFESQDDANRWYCPNDRVIYFYYCGGYDEGSKCLIGYSNYSEADGFVTSPPLKLEGGKTYRITTDFYGHQREAPFDLKLTMGTSGEDLSGAQVLRELKDYSYENMYTREKFEDMFTAPTTGTYYFGMSVATHNQYNCFKLFGINVDYVAENDLKAFSIDGIQEAVADYNNKCTVKVRNVGSKTQSKYSVKVYCDDEGTKTLVGETTEVPTIEAGKVADIPVTFKPTKDGMFDFFAVVDLEGDQDHKNDTTAIAHIKVYPAGTTPWTNIVTSGKDEKEDTHGPCLNSDAYEKTQSVYLSTEVNAEKGGQIKRLGYIYNSNDNLTDRTDPFNVKIYLGHTDKKNFTTNDEWLPENELTLVYDGTFTLQPGRDNILAFDLNTPFKYDNTKNLVVVFDKEGAVPSDIQFCALYKVFNSNWNNTANNYRTLEYSNKSPFDATKSHVYRSAPILYLGIDVPNSINNTYVAGKTFFYDANSGIMTFMKDIQIANFYSVDGKLVKTVKVSGNEKTKLNLPTGLYIVRTIDRNGAATSVKLNVK